MKSTLLALVALTFFCLDGVLARTHSKRDIASRQQHSRRASRKCRVRTSAATVSSTRKVKKPKAGAKAAPANPLKSTELLSINGIYVGFLPDNGDSGGVAQDINELNAYIGAKSFSVGLYAHVLPTEAFDGSELFDIGASKLMGQSGLDAGSVDRNSVKITKDGLFKQVVESGAVLVTSIMPVNGWDGLTSDNNTQAVRIAKALRRYTDAGVVVWNRFAHEANWYNSDSCNEAPGGGKVYLGGPEDVKEAWAVMSAAIKKEAPTVKMYWSPNAGSQDQIEQYAPADTSTIDVVGIDWYPGDASASLPGSYQWLHDKYASATVPFTVGETGSTASIDQRQALLTAWTSPEVASAMPNFKLVNWFNYNKGADFMLGGSACGDCDKTQVQSFFKGQASS